LNSKKLTSLLFKTAKEALFGMLENKDFLGAQSGMIAKFCKVVFKRKF
jgi:hypothetical protein